MTFNWIPQAILLDKAWMRDQREAVEQIENEERRIGGLVDTQAMEVFRVPFT